MLCYVIWTVSYRRTAFVLLIFWVKCVFFNGFSYLFFVSAVCLFSTNLFLNNEKARSSALSFRCRFCLYVFFSFFRLMLTTTRTHSFHRMDSISSNDSNPIRHLHKIRLINNFCLSRIFSSLSFNGNRITKFSVFFDVLGYEFRCVVDATATGDMKLWKMIPFSFDCFHLNFVYFNN